MIKKILVALLIIGIMIGSTVMVVSIQKGMLLPDLNGGTQTEQPGEEPGNNEDNEEQKNSNITLSKDYIYF